MKSWVLPLKSGAEWACVALAAWFMASFVYVAASSLTYPFQLEWMEGHVIDVIARIRQGLPIYTQPHLDYVPLIYTPYYYYVAAFVSLFTGVDFLPARLVSLASTLGSGFILFHWLKRETANWKAGAIAAGLFFATYALSGRWFDVSRIDTLNLLLMLAGLYVFYFYRERAHALLAAVLLTMAFFTKQSTLIAVVPALMAGLWLSRAHALRTLALFAALTITGIFWADWMTDGWFGFYVFTVPAGHHWIRGMYLDFWTYDMSKIGLLFAVCLLGIVPLWRNNPKKAFWYVAFTAGFIACSYAARLHYGGWKNVLIPAHAMLAFCAGLALAQLAKNRTAYVPLLALLLITGQFKLLYYNPQRLIPSQQAREAGERFLKEISRIQGDIFTSEIQFVQTRAGKKSYAYGMAAYDVYRSNLGDKDYVKKALKKELLDALENRRFSAIISGHLLRIREKDRTYRFDRYIDYPQEYVTGAITSMRRNLFVPKEKGGEGYDETP